MTISLPKYDEFMKPVLATLDALGGSGSIEEIDEGVFALTGLTQKQLDLTYPKSGAPVAPDRVSWARSYMKLAGLVDNPTRGVWVLTEAGREALDLPDATIRRRVADAFNANEAARRAKKAEGAEPLGDLDGGGAEQDWSDLLLQRLQAIDPSAFERLCQRLLRESGFTRVEVTGKTGDGGIDGVGVLRVNLVSFHVLFQCKRYKGSVGSETVRNFRGAMQGRADKGLIITTGTFTSEARREATRDGAPAIDLIDGEYLCQLLRDKELGVKVREVKTFEVTLDEGFFEGI